MEKRKSMKIEFQHKDVFYSNPAEGWQNGVYYPRKAKEQLGDTFFREENTIWVIKSQVWKEIEETGYGIYYYEETTKLVAELSGSNYKIDVIFINPKEEPYTCHTRINGVVKEEAITVSPGEEKKVSMVACIIDGTVSLTFVTGALQEIDNNIVSGEVYIKDIAVTPEKEKEAREKPRVYLVSDSTVQSYEKRFYPQTGWGQVLYEFFQDAEKCKMYRSEHCSYSLAKVYEMPNLVIENRSIGGRSARSFYDEGKLDQVLEEICPGDYMFVQFAHNDATAIRPNRYIAPEEFPYFIQRYIDGCKRRGAQCVLVTPVAMRNCGEGEEFHISFQPYREKMIEIAKEQGLPLLDLGARSTAYLNEIGAEESKHIYLWVEEGEYPDGAYAAGVSDKAHLQEYGARVYANMVVKMIQEYTKDHSLDKLKALAVPKDKLEKPKRNIGGSKNNQEKPADMVTGFVLQEVSIENGQGSFLLNWNPVDKATAYYVYAKKKEELTFEVVKTVTKEEKELFATLPFTAETGFCWQYYVTAVFENGSEGHASKMVEVQL